MTAKGALSALSFKKSKKILKKYVIFHDFTRITYREIWSLYCRKRGTYDG